MEAIFERALSDPAYERRAESVADQVQSEDGVAVARSVIEGLLRTEGAEGGTLS